MENVEWNKKGLGAAWEERIKYYVTRSEGYSLVNRRDPEGGGVYNNMLGEKLGVGADMASVVGRGWGIESWRKSYQNFYIFLRDCRTRQGFKLSLWGDRL